MYDYCQPMLSHFLCYDFVKQQTAMKPRLLRNYDNISTDSVTSNNCKRVVFLN